LKAARGRKFSSRDWRVGTLALSFGFLLGCAKAVDVEKLYEFLRVLLL